MNRYSRGFGLIELMIALVLSLIVILGVVQIFIAAKIPTSARMPPR